MCTYGGVSVSSVLFAAPGVGPGAGSAAGSDAGVAGSSLAGAGSCATGVGRGADPSVGPGVGAAAGSDTGAGGSGVGSATDAGGPSGATGVGSATVTVGAVGFDAGAAPPVVTVDVTASGGSFTIGSLTCGIGPWYSRSPPPPPPYILAPPVLWARLRDERPLWLLIQWSQKRLETWLRTAQ